MRCTTYWVQKPLQGRSRRANRPWGANVWGVEIGTDWTGIFNHKQPQEQNHSTLESGVAKRWKGPWPSNWDWWDLLNLCEHGKWLVFITHSLDAENLSRHFSPLLSFKSFATSCANRPWGANVWGVEIGTDWTGTFPSISWGWKCGASSTGRFCW